MRGHELRNPLAAISARISLFNQEEVSPELSLRAREIIGRQSQRLGKIVDELLEAHQRFSYELLAAVSKHSRIGMSEVVEQVRHQKFGKAVR